MRKSFEITSDLEFYCYLKATLEPTYQIIAEPSKSYYSEWNYYYLVIKDDCVVEEICGSYQEIQTGYLVSLAKTLIMRLKGDNHAYWQ
jgi:hypothetical protein